MPARRTKGDGGLTQRHDHKSCPAPVEQLDPDAGVMVLVRPEHRCRGRWQGTVDVTDASGKRRRKYVYGRTKEEARDKLRKAIQARDSGTLVLDSLTVEAWLWHWLDTIAEVRPQTHRGYASKIRTYLVPHIGRHQLAKLQPEHIRLMYRDMRTRGLAEASLRQTHAILARALKVAMQEGKIARNPIESVKPPSTKTNKRARLTVRQAGRVLEATDDARWWLAVFYGMRQGEVLGLRWCDIDFENGLLYVNQTLQKGKDGKTFFGPPKSDAGERTIPLIPVMAARLKLAHAAAGSPPPESGELVFPRMKRDGTHGPRDPRKDWAQWRELLAAAGSEEKPLPAVSLHSARNSAADLLEAAGVSARLAGQILGHANIKQTENYQHAAAEQMLAALEAGASLLALTELDVEALSDDVVEGEVVDDE